jgi:hypothetical protein
MMNEEENFIQYYNRRHGDNRYSNNLTRQQLEITLSNKLVKTRKNFIEKPLTKTAAFQITLPNEYLKIKHKRRLEDQKQKISSENWICSDTRMRQLRREYCELDKVASNTITVNTDVQRMNYELLKPNRADNNGSIKYQRCGCCLIEYHPSNLPYEVTKKAILDKRRHWRGESIVRDVIPLSLYDKASLCLFCSQFFTNPEEFRPNSSQLRRKDADEKEKTRYLQEQLKWDPLKLLEMAQDI